MVLVLVLSRAAVADEGHNQDEKLKLIGKINCVNVMEAAGTLSPGSCAVRDGLLANAVDRGLHA